MHEGKILEIVVGIIAILAFTSIHWIAALRENAHKFTPRRKKSSRHQFPTFPIDEE